MSPMTDPRDADDPAGLDVADEYRGLSAWGSALEARHAALTAIADQLNAWVRHIHAADRAAGDSDSGPTALAQAYELLWSAYEAEHSLLNEQFLLLDVGFDVLAQAAERLGIDLDELDDEPGRPWDQDPDPDWA